MRGYFQASQPMNQLNKRNFLKSTVMAGIGASVFHPDTARLEAAEETKTAAAQKPRSTKKVVVGGAGIAGMCCAYELMKKGHEVVVLEASGRHGGHVFTTRDGLSDGLYADFGQEHITKPGYERYWQYIEEFKLTALPYPRRRNLMRRFNNKYYSEEMLRDPAELKNLGYNEKEVKYLSAHPFWDLKSLYLNPYLDQFTDEYQPFGIGYDDLDKMSVADLYKKDGASKAALGQMEGHGSSALYELWMAAILKLRGVPLFPPELFRLKDGNQMLPNAFAKKLGDRVRLNCPIVSILNGESGVTVTYKQNNEQKEISADYFVNCIPLPAFRNIPVEPALPPERQYIVDNVSYDSYQRFVFQASSQFWKNDGVSINLDTNHADLWAVWQSAEEVDTHRVIVLGTGPGGISPQRALAAFREVYPGKKDSIEQVVSRDWTKEKFSPTCERLAFPIGELAKFWPHLMKPQGRIHFAGAYADNLNWGTEAATRSANRVATEIDKA
jgi:monoamine oxidase